MKQNGFTVIELTVVIALFLAAGVLFFVQKSSVETAGRDEMRKISINSIYYSLEESYFPKHKSYPKNVNEKTLTTVDPATFTDPNGIKLSQTSIKVGDKELPVQSDFRYEPENCVGDTCKGYVLRADLENEADFVKTSRNN